MGDANMRPGLFFKAQQVQPMATATIETKPRHPVRLRTNFGSHSRVAKVFSFDASAGCASVRYEHGGIETVPLTELESLDADNKYTDTEATVRRMAEEIVGEG